jgi:hypothetical protein
VFWGLCVSTLLVVLCAEELYKVHTNSGKRPHSPKLFRLGSRLPGSAFEAPVDSETSRHVSYVHCNSAPTFVLDLYYLGMTLLF